MKFSQDIDRLTSDAIRDIQGELLVRTVNTVFEKSPYYRRVFDGCGLAPSDIRGLDDLEKIPFTDRADLQKENWAFLSVHKDDIAEVVSTTGTTGEPVFMALTGNDLIRLAYNEEKSFGYAGVGKGDFFHIAVTCDSLFVAGIAYYSGLRRLGASVARIGPQNIKRHLRLIQELKPNGIVAVPSFMVQMMRRACEHGLDVRELGIEKAVLIGESIRNADFSSGSLGSLIENSFGNTCYSTYGITEGQVSFCECHERRGLHSHPDLVAIEIVDDNGKQLSDSETGELVVTVFQVEGMPLIRYRTGDITFRVSGRCPCGRNSIRIGPVLGRKHHRLKVKGVTLYPRTIENAVFEIKDVLNYQIEAYTGDDYTDHIIVRVGAHGNNKELRSLLADNLRAKAMVTPEIEIESPEEVRKRLFEGGSRKANTFKDRRNRTV